MLQRILFSDKVHPLLGKALDAYAMRQKTIAGNMANISTPGYQRMDVSFENELRDAVNHPQRLQGVETDSGHIRLRTSSLDDLRPRVQRTDDPVLDSGINNVNVDEEMAELANNTILYATMTNYMQRRVRMLRSAITGRTG